MEFCRNGTRIKKFKKTQALKKPFIKASPVGSLEDRFVRISQSQEIYQIRGINMANSEHFNNKPSCLSAICVVISKKAKKVNLMAIKATLRSFFL